MARKGSFGVGLNPFGTGSFGGLSQYDIGGSADVTAKALADLSVYQTEVAWGNGQATDAEYLAALQRAAAASEAGTRDAISDANKVADAQYRIGRSQAEARGLDALIAFDQQAISGMSPDSLRYRDVLDSLQAELAQRRSRDYGSLVNAYNDGRLSTESLLGWVEATLSRLTPDDPDFTNWSNVRGDLGERITGEKDSAVYQDYQRGRITSTVFLAYITARRDSYDPVSPQWDEWSNKVEDATVQIKETNQARADSAFFNLYQEGKKSDASYMLYLSRRIAGMAADDPQRGEWQHRLNQASFSLAEDKLRKDLGRAENAIAIGSKPSRAQLARIEAGQVRLKDFYTAYRATLNPGSAEYRSLSATIDSLARSLAAPAPKAGGTGGTAGTGNAGAAVGKGPALTFAGGKLISPKYTLGNVLGLMTINPNAGKKDIAVATKFLGANKSALENAEQRGDYVWLFQDPRTPGSLVAALNPDGSPVTDDTVRRFGALPGVYRDKSGTWVTRGSAYLPVQSEALSNLKTVEAANFMAAAEVALAKGKYGDFASLTRRAGEALNSARLVDSQARAQNWDDVYKATVTAVDKLTQAGDYGLALEMSTALAIQLDEEGRNPFLDQTRRDRLEEIGQKLADNPIVPKDGIEGAVSLNAVARGFGGLNPGWHHVLKSNDKGQPDWGPVFDAKQDGSWEKRADGSLAHVEVLTSLGDRIVRGEAAVGKSPLDPTIRVKTPSGWKDIVADSQVQMLHFVDENGQVQRAYSLDGQTWIRPASGALAPMIEFNADLGLRLVTVGGVSSYEDAEGETVMTENADGGWDEAPAWFKANPGARAWYGQAAWEANKGKVEALSAADKDVLSGPAKQLVARFLASRFNVGGPGQSMTLATTSPSGVVNLTPAGWRPAPTQAMVDADRRRLGSVRTQVEPTVPSSGLEGGRGVPGGRPVYVRPPDAETRYSVLAEQAYQRQLPADTPPRYEGSPTSRSGVTYQPPRFAPSSALPGLTPPPAYVPPAYVPPALRPSGSGVTYTPPRVVTTAPPPLRVSTATLTAADTRRLGSTVVKPPPPPPVKTPTATPGVYRPPTVTQSGPLR